MSEGMVSMFLLTAFPEFAFLNWHTLKVYFSVYISAPLVCTVTHVVTKSTRAVSLLHELIE